jgi:UDP-2,3-diacylglucosamine hydrolase
MIYFASDLHLGAPNYEKSRQREALFINWLNDIRPHVTELYIVGDLFDFWFEYKQVVPKGYVRLLGKLAEWTDQGIPIHFFTGNHDLWTKDYLSQEIGLQVHRNPITVQYNGKTLLIGHGDGLGPNDIGYKLMKRYLFLNPICQYLLHALHPDIGVGIANFFSRRSRLVNGDADLIFKGNDQEWLVQYALRKLETQAIDYFIFGHRHLPLSIPLNEKSTYINLGDWIQYHSYATFDGQTVQLCYYLNENKP